MTPPASKSSTATILIVEDDQQTRELYEEILKDAGYTVATATDGEQGLQMIKDTKYDLILLDIMLPKLDGLKVLEQAQKLIKPKRQPIIVMTNMASISILQEAQTLGALNTLIKSDQSPDTFLGFVQKHLSELKN